MTCQYDIATGGVLATHHDKTGYHLQHLGVPPPPPLIPLNVHPIVAQII